MLCKMHPKSFIFLDNELFIVTCNLQLWKLKSKAFWNFLLSISPDIQNPADKKLTILRILLISQEHSPTTMILTQTGWRRINKNIVLVNILIGDFWSCSTDKLVAEWFHQEVKRNIKLTIRKSSKAFCIHQRKDATFFKLILRDMQQLS